MDAIVRWGTRSDGLPDMEIDFKQFPGSSRLTWDWQDNKFRVTMEFGSSSNSLYMDVSQHTTRSEMEEYLDMLYKAGVERGFVDVKPLAKTVNAPTNSIETWYEQQPDWVKIVLGLGGAAAVTLLASWYGGQVVKNVEQDINELKSLKEMDAKIRMQGMYQGFYQDPMHDAVLKIMLFIDALSNSKSRSLFGWANQLSQNQGRGRPDS